MAKDAKGHGSDQRIYGTGKRPRVVEAMKTRPFRVEAGSGSKRPFRVEGPLQTNKPHPVEAVKSSGAPAKSRPRVVPAPGSVGRKVSSTTQNRRY